MSRAAYYLDRRVRGQHARRLQVVRYDQAGLSQINTGAFWWRIESTTSASVLVYKVDT
jgi:hypothetical protein